MKELSIEEKAKAYDEALKVLHKYDGANIMFSQSLKEEMFPELKESEDERIRKEMIDFFKDRKARLDRMKDMLDPSNFPCEDYSLCEKAIAWLEKQGEPTDILANAVLDSNEDGLIAETIQSKPKFKVGDWVMLDRPVLITKVKDMPYNFHEYWTSENTWFGDATKAKLWTIQDAKAGDVLAVTMYTKETWIGIFKEYNGCTFSSYCFVNTEGTFKLGTDNHGNGIAIHPATKEQRDLLFQKMKEAGYEWDAEKKELRKIEQKPAWSEEDEYLLDETIKHLEALIRITKKQGSAYSDEIQYYQRDIDWLKSLKERVQPQPKQEWSEEDERKIDFLIDLIQVQLPYKKYKFDVGKNSRFITKEEIVTMFKSLRPQSHWKPSDEQLTQLYYASTGVSYSRATLLSLLEQLRKLKE